MFFCILLVDSNARQNWRMKYTPLCDTPLYYIQYKQTHTKRNTREGGGGWEKATTLVKSVGKQLPTAES